jgi:hypothetical protein
LLVLLLLLLLLLLCFVLLLRILLCCVPCSMKQRPSFKEAFGAAQGLSAARYLLPAVVWSGFAKLTGRY